MATPFQTEAWTEYGLGTLVLLLRYFARWKSVGFMGWKGDDYFALAALVFWTAELAMLELIGQNGTNIGIPDEVGATLPEAQIKAFELGSKYLLAGWNFYVTLIWCLKGCMLCYFHRITMGLKQDKFVKGTMIACVLAYVGIILVLWCHCVPVQRNWQVYPNPGEECTRAVANYLALVVLNVTTDVAIVSIPLPLLWKVRLSIRRKLMIGTLLCSGVFVMAATVCRCVLSLQSIDGINVSTIWAIRETFVGIVAVNAAAIWPLFSQNKWLKSSKGTGSSGHKHSGMDSHHLVTIGGASRTHGTLSSKRGGKSVMRDLEENSSEEFIVATAESMGGFRSNARAGSNKSWDNEGIVVTKAYEITS